MHTVEILEQACWAARQLGFEIRQEWLGGADGGACFYGGQKWLFIDLSLPALDQLDQVVTALREEPGLRSLQLSPSLASILGVRRAA